VAKKNQHFAKVEYNLQGKRLGTFTNVPAHPAFKEALEALPPHVFMVDTDVLGTRKKSKGIPWGIPTAISIAPADVPLLGLPPLEIVSHRGVMAPSAILLVTRTHRRGELPEVVNLVAQEGLLRGTLMLHSDRDHILRTGLNQPFFWTWRCGIHEDCLDNPELGQACCTTRSRGILGQPRLHRGTLPAPRAQQLGHLERLGRLEQRR